MQQLDQRMVNTHINVMLLFLGSLLCLLLVPTIEADDYDFEVSFDWEVTGCQSDNNTHHIAYFDLFEAFNGFLDLNETIALTVNSSSCQKYPMSFTFEGRNNTVQLRWRSSSSLNSTTCCWSVSKVDIYIRNSTASIQNINICNIQHAYSYNNRTWVCPHESGPLKNNVQILSNLVIIRPNDTYEASGRQQCTNTSQPQLLVQPPIANTEDNQTEEQNTQCIQFYCEQDGIWSVTQWNTNTTVDNACYDRTVPGTRRCNETGEWEEPYCVVSVEFSNALIKIRNNPREGLELLNQSIAATSDNVNPTGLSPIQYVYLLETVADVYSRLREEKVTLEEAQIILIVADKISQSIVTTASVSSMDIQQEGIVRLLNVLDDIALTIATPSNVTLTTDKIVLAILNFNDVPSEDVKTIQVESDSIVIPPDVFKSDNTQQTIRVASFHYRSIAQLLPPRDPNSTIVSSIISATTNCASCPVNNLDRNVTIQLQIEVVPQRSESILCSFFQFDYPDNDRGISIGGDWSTSGCTTVSVDGDLVTCSCNHLTHFAILLSPGGPEISPIHYKVLNTIGLVLVPISLLCMVMVILTFSLIRSLWNIRNYVHIMLCVSLFMAQLVFIIGVDKIENQDVCSAVAVILLYLFLVTFMWMLMEGVVLYVTLVRVLITNHKYYIIAFTVSSYVIPAVYLMGIAPIGYLINTHNITDHTHFLYYDYEDKKITACWLNYSTGFVWSFIAPVIVIIMINIVFFIMALVIAKKHSTRQKTSTEIRHWLMVTISLTVVMGIAWLVGVMAFSRELLPVVYITTIFIAAQGIILFIILVPLNKQVRKAFLAIWTKKKKKILAYSAFLSATNPNVQTKTTITINSGNDMKISW